ncbi:MAG: hypothetical protein R3C52_09430 [Hyphomonadaceae bacterium]
MKRNKTNTGMLAALCGGVAALGIALLAPNAPLAPPANAKPPAPMAFCHAYPDAKACSSGFTDCATCHTTPPARNAFGLQVEANLAPGLPRPLSDEAFLKYLPEALKAVEDLDADTDGFSNIVEIMAGTQTADATSVPRMLACAPEDKARAAGALWNVCEYDPAYAYRKVHLDFCGQSPSRSNMDAFLKVEDQNEKLNRIGQALDQCLNSTYWLGKDGVVWNMANAKIRPAHAVKSGDNPGPVPLGDYDDDYNLFTWANSDDNDVRDLLLAQYFVKRTSSDPVRLEQVSETELAARPRGTKQPVPEEKRAGMITTRWFAAVHTMFTAIPRTTAAQAYRSYLGYDIAKMEGLHSVSNEPVDYDAKGVNAPACAVCHATLDPLSYPFTRYNGISGNYTYNDKRLLDYVRVDGAHVADAPASGMILGQPVSDLREWAEVAANSDAFAMKVTGDYWKLLIGRDPDVNDQPEFNRLWRGLKSETTYNYRVERMLHDLVLTNAYGRP